MKFSFKLEEIKYVKLAYKDSEGFVEKTKAAMKDINEKEILVCTKFDDDLDVETPQEIDFSVICIDGLYKTKTILKSVEKDEPYIFFILETPAGMEYQQNREFFRVPVSYDCRYVIELNNEIKEFYCTTADISANGISIILPNHVISENLSDLTVNIDGIRIATKVKYVRSEKTNDGYRISFSFARISELDRDYISQVCLKKQLEQKRNSLM